MKRYEIVNHPGFQSLLEFERLRLLWELDPEFRKLAPAERWRVARDEPDDLAPHPPPEEERRL